MKTDRQITELKIKPLKKQMVIKGKNFAVDEFGTRKLIGTFSDLVELTDMTLLSKLISSATKNKSVVQAPSPDDDTEPFLEEEPDDGVVLDNKDDGVEQEAVPMPAGLAKSLNDPINKNAGELR